MIRKVLFFIAPIFLAAVVFFGYQFFFNREVGKGALQVTSIPQASVFANGVFIGKTPLCKCEAKDMLPVGEYTIKLVPSQDGLSAFEEKVTINPNVLTVIDRSFGTAGSSSGSVITLSALSDPEAKELSIVSIPQGASVIIDSQDVGTTPYRSSDISESDHEVKLSKAGFDEKTVRIKITKGYKLSAAVFLSANPNAPVASESAKEDAATGTAVLTPEALGKIVISQTPNGFLRVREQPTTTSTELTRVNSGETFDILDEQNGWYKITASDGVSGWVSADYATKQ